MITSILMNLIIFCSIFIVLIVLMQKTSSDGILSSSAGNANNRQSTVDGIVKFTRVLIAIFFTLILIRGFIVKRISIKYSISNKILDLEKEIEQQKLIPTLPSK